MISKCNHVAYCSHNFAEKFKNMKSYISSDNTFHVEECPLDLEEEWFEGPVFCVDKDCNNCLTALSFMVEHTDNIDEQIEIYQRLVNVSEEIVLELEEEGCFEDPIFCSDIDWYAGSMDNLAVLYLERKEYAKAVPLFERALQLYRIQEEFCNSIFVWQRYYALKRLVQCYAELGNKTMANICRYEQVLLERKNEMLIHKDFSGQKQDAVK